MSKSEQVTFEKYFAAAPFGSFVGCGRNGYPCGSSLADTSLTSASLLSISSEDTGTFGSTTSSICFAKRSKRLVLQDGYLSICVEYRNICITEKKVVLHAGPEYFRSEK